MHLPAQADGGPHQRIGPGDTWTPTWTIDQPPATLWYHAHPEGATGDQVYRGVAGLFLIDDPTTDTASCLPHRYGVDDLPLIIRDKRFTNDGQLNARAPRFSPIGLLGDEILVNGTHDPHFDATTTRLRLRAAARPGGSETSEAIHSRSPIPAGVGARPARLAASSRVPGRLRPKAWVGPPTTSSPTCVSMDTGAVPTSTRLTAVPDERPSAIAVATSLVFPNVDSTTISASIRPHLHLRVWRSPEHCPEAKVPGDRPWDHF